MTRRLLVIIAMLGIASLMAPPVRTQSDPSVQGQWSAVQTWPYRAIHAVLLTTGKVLFWDSYDLADNPQLWDPVTNQITAAAKANYNIFCTGFALRTDGRLFMAGGHVADNVGLPYAFSYDPFTNAWTRHPDMNAGRWYPTVTNLANGDLLVLSGVRDTSVGMNLLPQVWQPATSTWRNLTNAQLQLPFYPFAFLAPDGRVFSAGPSQVTRSLNTTGAGAWTVVANSAYGSRNWGTAAMYEPGKVLIVGGSQCAPYDANCANVTATAEVIDLNAGTPAWRGVTAMASPRKQHNATILPDGRVLVTGGSSGALGYDDETHPVYTAEVWTPSTERWTTWASASVYRGYHATALLLPDGRVMQAGGNKGGASAELFSPPYLFAGARPSITAAPDAVAYGQTFFVQTAATNVGQVTLVRLGAVTHAFNMTQRFNRLAFSATTGGVNAVAPANATLAPPGYYMLFLLNTAGVPSLAKIVRLDSPGGAGTPAAPSNLTATAISSSQINLAWIDNALNEDGFAIERCQGAGCSTFTQIATVGANAGSFADTGLSGQTTYTYRVLAVNAAGSSAYSNTSTATTPAAPPLAPANLSASPQGNGSITLRWNDVSNNESGFRIERCTGSTCTNFAQIAQTAPNAIAYRDGTTTSGVTYRYRALAFNAAGVSPYTSIVSATAR